MDYRDLKRRIALERLEAGRTALEIAARHLENYETNELYAKAMKLAAKLIRDNTGDFTQKLNADLRDIPLEDRLAGSS